MPMCIINTNLEQKDIPEGFEARLAQKIASILNKPLPAMTVMVKSGLRMYRRESTEPTCVLQLHSVAVFDEVRNLNYTPPILEFLRSELKLAEGRVVVHYFTAERYMFGQ